MMSCCSGNSEKSLSKVDSNHNNESRKRFNVGKTLVVILHLSILAVLILGDEIRFLEDNLQYFILGYVLLFVSIIVIGNRKRSDI